MSSRPSASIARLASAVAAAALIIAGTTFQAAAPARAHSRPTPPSSPTPPSPARFAVAGQATADQPLRVGSFNIHHGTGNDLCTPPAPGTPPGPDCALNLDRIADVIRAQQLDVVGLQEVDRLWARSGYVDQAARLSRALRMFACYGANLSHQPDTHSTRPHQYGTLILSRYPVLSCDNSLLPKATPNTEQRGLAHALIDVNGLPVHVYNTHLHTVQADRAVQVPAIDALIAANAPAVLVGDFNAQPTEPTLAVLQARFQDAWVAAGTGPGFTYPASPAATPNRRIDYIFVTRDATVSDVTVDITADSSMAADHYPLVAAIVAPASAAAAGAPAAAAAAPVRQP